MRDPDEPNGRIDPVRWRELSPFLDAALELAGEERAAWLEALRTQQPVLAAELQSLLAEEPAIEQEGFLESDPSRMLARPSLEGQTIGAYTLESAIGHGGMGSVWLARRSDGRFEGKVAVKLLNIALIGRGGEERFRREGRVLAKLAHPNIARILDAGITNTAQPYLVLEYIEGSSIDRYCDERGLGIEARLELFLDVLAAVGHAHANLIVHRDIKPSNIYVAEGGIVKLLDFGIAKLIEDDDQSGAATELTRDGGRLLTPDYAAPEQVQGAPITVATDVYALGVLLYLLLCGLHPSGEKDTSGLQYMRRLLETEPLRLSDAVTAARSRDPTTLEENAAKRAVNALKLKRVLHGDLDNIVAKALKRNPQERYASAREFADDLRRYLQNEPVLARADNPWYRVRKFVARNRLPVAVGGAALAAVLVAAAIALFEARAANAQRDRALALSSRNEAVADFLNTLITEAAGADKPVSVSDMLERSEALARAEYRNNPKHRAAVLDMLGVYYGMGSKESRGESLLREARDAVKTSADGDLRRKLTCDHAMTLAMIDKVSDAIQELNAVIDDPQLTARQAVDCMTYLAYTAERTDDPAGALKFANLALQHLHQVESPSPTLEASVLVSLGDAENLNGHNSAADQLYARALAQYAQAGRDGGRDANTVRNNWAVASSGSGNPKRALELLEQMMRIIAQNDPTARVNTILMFNRARELEFLGRFRQAREEYSQCAALGGQADMSVGRVGCQIGLASVSRELGDMASADSYLSAASASVAASPPGSPVVVRLKMQRAAIALARGRLEGVRADLDAAIAESKNIYLLMESLRTRAELNLNENKLAAAEADARRALALAQTAQGDEPFSNRTGAAWLILGRVLVKGADAGRAQSAFHAAIENLSNTVDADHPMLLRARQLARD